MKSDDWLIVLEVAVAVSFIVGVVILIRNKKKRAQ
jgi:low affinity Fe/Cu permease